MSGQGRGRCGGGRTRLLTYTTKMFLPSSHAPYVNLQDDGDSSDGYEEPTKKKRRGAGAAKGASAAATSIKDKHKEVATKIKKGERKGEVPKNAEERDSKDQGHGRQKKQEKKQTAAGGAGAIAVDAPAPVVGVVKELFPEDSSSNHHGHGIEVDNNDNRVEEKPSKSSKTSKSKSKSAAAASPVADPAPPAAAKTKAAAAMKGVPPATFSSATVSTTAPGPDQVIAAPSVAVAMAAASGAANTQGAPPRGQSSFALFCAVQKPLLLAEHPDAANSTVVKVGSDLSPLFSTPSLKTL